MKATSLVITCGALALAQRTALWVPDCGDEVLMLGTNVADEFRSLNTLSVEDINTILAFNTYTVVYESTAPSGFRYVGGYLVKDPLPQQLVTTCTTPLSGIGGANRATPTGLSSTSTKAETGNATIAATSRSPQMATATSCYTTGQPVSKSAEVMDQVFSFCGVHTSLAIPTRISSTVTYGGLQMLFQVNPATCDTEGGATRRDVMFVRPTGGMPTDSLQAFNRAFWPCVHLWNLWEYCNDDHDNEGRGGSGILDCMEFSLRPL
ncbi:hypothetical protein G3M48_001617 [Beauveria asiatica]|uniref:Uncharacterized protein n=1 Tax=Beauveria asiatica TaxID=1069075 RepID=A0AAW0RFX5_9HYPO